MTNPRQQQALLRAILESPKDIVIFALDRQYRYLAFNENHARTIKLIWGVELSVGLCMLDIIGREDDRQRARANFDRALRGEHFTVIEQYGDELLNRRYYEDIYSPIYDEHNEVIGLTVYLTDITSRLAAEQELVKYRTHLEELVRQRTQELEAAHAQLLHAQKLESLGVLAGGIAHDFNNLLAVMLGRTELAMGTLNPEHPAQMHLQTLQEAALEARLLTKQLLGYAGRGKFLVQKVVLRELVESMAQLLRASINKSISLHFEHDPTPVVVEIDVTQLRQVLLNLAVNAAEAIGDVPGHITIRTKRVGADSELLQRASAKTDLSPGPVACIEVEDTGCGMDDRVRARLFDPFFTTKFSGRGLGLAAVLGIITAHRGTILVRSEPGCGTCFSVLLPVASGAAEVALQSRAPIPLSVLGGGTILVVDDEAPVREVTAEFLEALGFRVLTAEGGEEARQLFRKHADEIVLVLLDLTMPTMSGEQTFRELLAIRGDVRVVIMTGYTQDEIRVQFPRAKLAGFLAKPFVRDELVSVVHEALRTPHRRAGRRMRR